MATTEQKRLFAFKDFQTEVRRIWSSGDALATLCTLNPEPYDASGTAHAALLVIGASKSKRAIGNYVIYRGTEYRLSLHSKFFKETESEQRRILIHEACHIGYAGHGSDFRKFCLSMGGAVTGAAVGTSTNRVAVEVKRPGMTRYQRLPETYATEREALAYVTAQQIAYRQNSPELRDPTKYCLAFI